MPNHGTIAANTEAINGVNADRCILERASNLSTPNDASLAGTNNWLTFPTGSGENKSVSGMHSPTSNSERIYPNLAGIGGTWHIDVIVTFGTNATGYRIVYLDWVVPAIPFTQTLVNLGVPAAASIFTGIAFSLDHSSGDTNDTDTGAYFALRTAQNSGGALDIMTSYTRFCVRRVGGTLL